MGSESTATLAYGTIIPQSKALELMQKLQNSTEAVTKFGYGNENCPSRLLELLGEHLKERGIGEEEDFEMVVLTTGDYECFGLAILYSGIDIGRVTVWGYGSEDFEPLSSGPWDKEQVEDADVAFKRLGEDSLFKDLNIEVQPGWLLGCNMSC